VQHRRMLQRVELGRCGVTPNVIGAFLPIFSAISHLE